MDIPEEFKVAAPRKVDEVFRRGRYGRRLGIEGILCLAFGTIGLLVSDTTFVKNWSWTFLPLSYLKPIAIVVGIYGLVQFLRWRSNSGHFAYLRKGVAVAAKVTKFEVLPGTEWQGRILNATPVVEVETEEPVFGATRHKLEHYPPLPLAWNTWITPEPGTSVTLVYLPEDKYSVRLYEFLGLHPKADIVRTTRPRLTLLHILFAAAILALCLALWVMGSYPLVDDAVADPIFLVGGTMGLVAAVAFDLYRYRASQELGAQPVDWIGRVSGALMGGAGGACLLASIFLLANGFWDSSEVAKRPVAPLEISQRTANFVYRTYELRYQDPVHGEKTYGLSPSELPTGEISGVQLLTKQGRLNQPWIVGVEWD